MILWLNSQDCCTSTEWNHGSYPSVNLKDFLRYLMKPPYKKHVHFFGEILCLNQQDEQCFCHPSDIPWILIGSKGSLQWLITIPTWLAGWFSIPSIDHSWPTRKLKRRFQDKLIRVGMIHNLVMWGLSIKNHEIRIHFLEIPTVA